MSAPVRPSVARPRPYKDYLTPALHRCFTNAALTTLVACWLGASLLSTRGWFWSWFPLGPNGILTGFLFICCLMVFLLRLTNVHIGLRTSQSPIDEFFSVFFSRQSLLTIFWYCLSAFLFIEVYIFSRKDSTTFGWIDIGRSYERPRLNERAIIMRGLGQELAVVQALLHLYLQYDALVISPPRKAVVRDGNIGRLSPALQRFVLAVKDSVILAAFELVFMISFGPVIYWAFFRDIAWNTAHYITRVIFTIQKSTERPDLSRRTELIDNWAFAAFILPLIWQMTNLAFTVFGSQEPLKKGIPITTDSTDPNGSLSNGLKSRKPIPHSMALWELQIIADRFPDRRRTIFSDFERPSSTAWSDIASICLAELDRVAQAITTAQTPPLPPSAAASQPAPLPPKQHIARPLKEDPAIYSPTARPRTTMDLLANEVGVMAKSVGQAQGNSPIALKARGMIMNTASSMSTSNPQSRASGFLKTFETYLVAFLRTQAGYPFRRTLRRRVNAIVFSRPYSKAADVTFAAQALTKLAVSSLQEDNFGQAQKDVPRIMRSFVATIQKIQSLLGTLEPHWTDVYFDGRRCVPEVEALLVTLKGGLEQIIIHFGEYIDALGISRAELQVAKQVAGRGQEMAQK